MMMNFILFLVVASFTGTILWLLQLSLKPITQKYFSSTWHYYASLIPVFFLLGGSVIINKLVPIIRSAYPNPYPTQNTGTFEETYAQVSTFQHTATSVNIWISQRFELNRFISTKELILIIIMVWAVGAAVFIVLKIRQYQAFKRFVFHGSRLIHNVQCPVKVITSPNATTPLIMGLWNPVVVLPAISLKTNELDMILSHELVHLKRGDLFLKLIVFAANAVHWFNPAAYNLNRQISMFCELSCDEKVVQHMDVESRNSYGETLLSMLEYGVMKRDVICTSGFCNPKKFMKRRLMNLMKEKKMNRPVWVLSLVTAIALVSGGGAAAYAAGSATHINIPTDKHLEGAGYNISVKYPDGTTVSYDKDGNRVASLPEPKKLNTEDIVDRIKKHIEKGLAVPQGYIDELPQKKLDAINESYQLKLQKSNSK